MLVEDRRVTDAYGVDCGKEKGFVFWVKKMKSLV
jgi:hypothetical protein